MRAPHLAPSYRPALTSAPVPVGMAVIVSLLGLVLSLVLGPAGNAAADGGQDPLSDRGAVQRARADNRDIPVMPAGCFGPGNGGARPDRPCHYNRFVRSRPTVVLWGDSHAWQYIPAVTAAVEGRRVNLVSFVAGSCAPLAVRHATPKGVCERSNAAAFAYVKKLHRRGSDVKALLGSNWSGFRIAYRRMQLEALGIDSGYEPYTKRMVMLSHEGTPLLFKRLGKLGVDVDVIAQAAVVPEHTAPCLSDDDPYRCDVSRWRALPEEGRTESWLRRQLQQVTGRAGYVETTDAYCTPLVCHGEVDDIVTFFDHLHLSASRTRALAPAFVPSFRAMLERR